MKRIACFLQNYFCISRCHPLEDLEKATPGRNIGLPRVSWDTKSSNSNSSLLLDLVRNKH